MTSATRTPKDVRKDLRRRGVSIAALARQLQAHDQTVRDLLSGKAKGYRGEAHRVAVLLGLKEGVITDHQPAANAATEARAA
ncbi:DNA-binding protein [Pseudaquabacterium pictum]|uniref:DNA-binding protein n=1 Tax=Pseudaquabacterium pictum TaxID=2315236 RepID=A0A480ARQ3_9BURK|nr:DNA-binding protein [Rubrivivax pictus]GCL64329.1 hypothetical protein AQPW35_34100 [Rubrivivax pictus]